jgi:hypothetical protein
MLGSLDYIKSDAEDDEKSRCMHAISVDVLAHLDTGIL